MSVRQLKNGKWVADVVVGVKWDGTPDRRTSTWPTEKRAQRAERALLVQKDGRRGVSGRITFDEFVEDIYWPQKKHLRAHTVRGYKRDIDLRLSPAFGGMDVEAIGRLQIQAMLNRCPSRKTATNARETLSSILTVALEMGMIASNPAGFHYQYPEPTDLPPDHCGVWLSDFGRHMEVLDHMRAVHGGQPVERMLVLGLCLGLRKEEVLGLDWERVDLKKREVSVEQVYGMAAHPFLDKPKTPKSRRKVPIPRYALERMMLWDRTRVTSPDLKGGRSHPVVAGRDGKRMSPATAENQVRRLRDEKIGGDPFPAITMMSCRHSFATACIREGIEVSTVSKWLGHKDVSTTYNRYVKPTLEDLHKDSKIVDSAHANAEKCRLKRGNRCS